MLTNGNYKIGNYVKTNLFCSLKTTMTCIDFRTQQASMSFGSKAIALSAFILLCFLFHLPYAVRLHKKNSSAAETEAQDSYLRHVMQLIKLLCYAIKHVQKCFCFLAQARPDMRCKWMISMHASTSGFLFSWGPVCS